MSIKHIRKKKGITQFELSKKINVDQTTVSKWESGEAKPRVDTLIKLAKLFECTVDELLEE